MYGAVSVDDLSVNNFIERRRAVVQGWAQILSAVEQSYDPTYDPANAANLVNTCVVPPFDATCNDDPKMVRDPKQRAIYTAALKANDRNMKRAIQYHDLYSADEAAMTSLEMTLYLLGEVAPAGTPADFTALDDILQTDDISESRRLKIDAMLRNPALDWVTLPGQSVRGLDATLYTLLENADAGMLSKENVEVWETAKTVVVLLARGPGNVLFFEFDKQTATVRKSRFQPLGSGGDGVGLSALDVRALLAVYRQLLSGSLSAPGALSDLRLANFTMQQRNFDRSHTTARTTYYVTYLPRNATPGAASPCGAYTNYRVDSLTLNAIVEPFRC